MYEPEPLSWATPDKHKTYHSVTAFSLHPCAVLVAALLLPLFFFFRETGVYGSNHTSTIVGEGLQGKSDQISFFIDILEVVEGHWQTLTLFYCGSRSGTKLFF